VYRGASKSVVLTPPQDNYYGEDGFGDFEFPNPPDPDKLLQNKHAAIALIDIVNQYPGTYKQAVIPNTDIGNSYAIERSCVSKIFNRYKV
jgi:inosine-uridine nucleoside N-ribohydrolase